jgi:hypothetical protein
MNECMNEKAQSDSRHWYLERTDALLVLEEDERRELGVALRREHVFLLNLKDAIVNRTQISIQIAVVVAHRGSVVIGSFVRCVCFGGRGVGLVGILFGEFPQSSY